MPDLREWNERQKTLRHDLEKGMNFSASIQLFTELEAMVHDSVMIPDQADIIHRIQISSSF
jgi:hypothetical protein